MKKFNSHREAIEYSKKIKWKLSLCTQGKKCWCRIIEPEEEIIYDKIEKLYISPAGGINKEYAKYIVKLHNENIK